MRGCREFTHTSCIAIFNLLVQSIAPPRNLRIGMVAIASRKS